jgi:BirA family biotin operon repressor/biotin-[acetyl-CoA-carboxylase] ligase
VGAELHRVARIGSTMDRLHQLAAAGAPAGTAVVADEQTGGRGSRGRPWHSPAGGLWLSVLYRPASAAGAELLSLRLGLAVAEALEEALPGLRIEIKWPNDLMLDQRKLGGILCEARWQGDAPGWIVAGVGLNVANPIRPLLGDSAVALAEVRPGVTPEGLLPAVLARLRRRMPAGEYLGAAEQELLASRDWLRGRQLRAPAPGRAEGIAPDGALLVRSPAGLAVVRGGSVELAGAASPR